MPTETCKPSFFIQLSAISEPSTTKAWHLLCARVTHDRHVRWFSRRIPETWSAAPRCAPALESRIMHEETACIALVTDCTAKPRNVEQQKTAMATAFWLLSRRFEHARRLPAVHSKCEAARSRDWSHIDIWPHVCFRAYTASAVNYMTSCVWLGKGRDSCFRKSRDSDLGHSF